MKKIKVYRSPEYNYIFNRESGQHLRWGRTPKEDAVMSPHGMEIADIEISTICHGGCSFCYKSNIPVGENMSLETFKKIFHKFPNTLTQIAFGIGDIDSNPDMLPIFKYCRDNGIIPNVTINGHGLNYEWADKLYNVCGAVAVSHYSDDVCYNAVQRLAEKGMQVNIHQLVSKETVGTCEKVIKQMEEEPRLSKLNATVFLGLKKKGKRNTFHIVDEERFGKMMNNALDKGLPVGCDSCSANKLLKVTKHRKDYSTIKDMVEPCEATLFSMYIDVKGHAYPCSFVANTNENNIDLRKGIDLTSDTITDKNFITNVWYSDLFHMFRTALRKNGRSCPVFEV